MFKIDTQKALKIIILFALINSSIFLAFIPQGALRLVIVILMNISGVLLITFFFKKIFKSPNMSLYFRVILFFLILWSISIFLRGFSLNGKLLITLFGHYLMGWAWLTPMAVVFGFDIENWFVLLYFLKKTVFFGALLGLGAFFYSTRQVFGLMEWVVLFVPLLLTSLYYRIISKSMMLFIVFSFLLLSVAGSQRANIVFFVLVIMFLIFEYFQESSIKIYNKIFLSLSLILMGMFLLLKVDAYISKASQNKEVTTNTRTFLFVELFADMSYSELIVGRGSLGRYYSPYFAEWNKHHTGGDSEMRSVSEVGYLEMILKGGFMIMGLYLLFLIPASFLGIFASKNIITRMSGYLILAYLLLWTVSYYPIYSAEYLILWMAAGTAVSKRLRRLTNEDLLIYIKRGNIYA